MSDTVPSTRRPPGLRTVEAARRRGRAWVDDRAPESLSSAAIDGWVRYRRMDGPLQSALLSLYVLVAVVPALLVVGDYMAAGPTEVATRLAHRYALSTETASVVRGALVQTSHHTLSSALVAIGGALFFGLGFGQVLQHVHVRAWELQLRIRTLDRARHAIVLLALYGVILLLFVQLRTIGGASHWVTAPLLPGWFVFLTAYFGWSGRLLTHDLVPWRDLLPGAAVGAIGVTALIVTGRFLMRWWVDFYASDYGAFGVVMAVFFWLAFCSAAVVAGATMAPALARRRALRRADARPPSYSPSASS